MIIYLDFDGTVVEHEYPKMGRCNFGCFNVMHKLQQVGQEIILNTYRADCANGTLEQAMRYLHPNRRNKLVAAITKYAPAKISPPPFNLRTAKMDGVLFIDDISSGIPLKPACMVNNNMVDWDVLDVLFQEHGIY